MIETSAPAKIILFGEHAVNRQQMALATALDVRTRCTFTPRQNGQVTFRSAQNVAATTCAELLKLARELDALYAAGDRAAILTHAQDFFAPAKYVYGTFLARYGGSGAYIEWQTEIPPGSGLGSAAAAGAALVLG